jgi:hypothetical protein
VTRRVTIATMASTDNAIIAMGLIVKGACSSVGKVSCRSWEEMILCASREFRLMIRIRVCQV